MTLQQAYAKRKQMLAYLQQLARPVGNHDPEAREKVIAKARAAYQKADQQYRELSRPKS